MTVEKLLKFGSLTDIEAQKQELDDSMTRLANEHERMTIMLSKVTFDDLSAAFAAMSHSARVTSEQLRTMSTRFQLWAHDKALDVKKSHQGEKGITGIGGTWGHWATIAGAAGSFGVNLICAGWGLKVSTSGLNDAALRAAFKPISQLGQMGTTMGSLGQGVGGGLQGHEQGVQTMSQADQQRLSGDHSNLAQQANTEAEQAKQAREKAAQAEAERHRGTMGNNN